MQDLFVIACPKGHPLARREKVKWSELGTYDYISLAQGSGNRLLIDQALSTSSSRPRWFCEVHHVPALVSLVEAGAGLGVVPRLAMPPDGHPTLASVPLYEPQVARTLGLIKRRGRALSAAAQLFYDLLIHSIA
jgi:DNA-binding transcriptional LysR family regulator